MPSIYGKTAAEIHKKLAEARLVQKDLERTKQEKKKKIEALRQEKTASYAELTSYNPWGKPGAGAPSGSNMMTGSFETPMEYSPFGKPGGGAPMKTTSGKLQATHKVDPEIRFQKRDRGQVIDVVGPNPKYVTQNPFVTELDKLATKTREERNVPKRNGEPAKFQCYDPFGKPGAGAPIRDSNGNVQSTRLTNAPVIDDAIVHDPFGRPGAGAPMRNAEGKISTHRTFNLATTVQEEDPRKENFKFKNQPRWNAYLKRQHLKREGERSRDVAKQRNYNEELEAHAREKVENREQEILRERQDSLTHAETWDSMWGKPGAGAPLDMSRRQRIDMWV